MSTTSVLHSLRASLLLLGGVLLQVGCEEEDLGAINDVMEGGKCGESGPYCGQWLACVDSRCAPSGGDGDACSEDSDCKSALCNDESVCAQELVREVPFEECELESMIVTRPTGKLHVVDCAVRHRKYSVDPYGTGASVLEDKKAVLLSATGSDSIDAPAPGSLVLRYVSSGRASLFNASASPTLDFITSDGTALAASGQLEITRGASTSLVDLEIDFLDIDEASGAASVYLPNAGDFEGFSITGTATLRGGGADPDLSMPGGGGAGSGGGGTSTLMGPSCNNTGTEFFCRDCRAEKDQADPYDLGGPGIQVWSECATACTYYDSSFDPMNTSSDAQANLAAMVGRACDVLEAYGKEYRERCEYCRP